MSDSLPSSKLGTKAHWDGAYSRELTTFAETGLEGEVWFGEDAAQEMVEWAEENMPLSSEGESPNILDVGCGNAHLLFLFNEAGYPARSLTGIDYSAHSIELATAIAKSKEVTGMRLEVSDMMSRDPAVNLPSGANGAVGWDLILDKGTYDAISLSSEEVDGQPLFRLYPQRIKKLLRPGGRILLTSCNWTEAELRDQFSSDDFVFHSIVPRPKFKFGGQEGSTITTIAFERTKNSS